MSLHTHKLQFFFTFIGLSAAVTQHIVKKIYGPVLRMDAGAFLGQNQIKSNQQLI